MCNASCGMGLCCLSIIVGSCLETVRESVHDVEVRNLGSLCCSRSGDVWIVDDFWTSVIV